MTTIFERHLQRWPWPPSRIEGVAPFQWSLDGGGRELIQEVIQSKPDAVLLELGCFMGGAPRAWLSQYPNLKCICVDPWGDNLVSYVKNLQNVDWALHSYGRETLAHYGELLARYGPMAIVRNNLKEFQDRCILVQGGAPGVFGELAAAGVSPDIVFLDALKQREEFLGASETFPDAIITGDDWSWRDQNGKYPVREFAAEIACHRGGKLYATRATFVISEPRHGLNIDEKYLVSEN
jgi:hypothetical protein